MEKREKKIVESTLGRETENLKMMEWGSEVERERKCGSPGMEELKIEGERKNVWG